MFKLMMLIASAALLLVSPAVAKPQVLVDYGYYAPASYVASYSSPLAYSYYPYAYSYSYPLAYYYKTFRECHSQNLEKEVVNGTKIV
ncbi:unnamed protein product [Arctia plantaginis]|uniref:Uncharacterized protein n=1 Tax=Arctia plantaginis TaxID=874455 RepID=A0A8S0YV53_ARCPL|nr:unnamed protein product [Arctia plantaginis]